MGNLTVKFLHKEYTIPKDVITYVGLVDFTNETRNNLVSAFNKLISIDVAMIENDDFMLSVINEQASKFISKLLNNEIYDKTANDYLQDNKGYKLFLDTKKKVLRQILSIEKEKLEVYSSGVQDAIYKKDSSVTGLDFGILSGSFVNHMIYAYMDASKQTKQEQEALKIYNKEIAELDKVAESYDQKEKSYILNNVIPAMYTVFTYFSYELLDRYVSDLIRVGKFDKAALDYINLERSNDLLKNLDLSDNKKAIIESAFVACPFNIAVYMQTMKYDLLDYASFQTAQSFKQGKKILEFLSESVGEVSYPKFSFPNVHSATLLAQYTNRNVDDVLFQHTVCYADAVVNEYSNIVKALSNTNYGSRFFNNLSDDEIIAGEKTSQSLSLAIVEQVVSNNVWNNLVEQCGHKELFERILDLLPNAGHINSKEEYDSYLTQELFLALEKVRKELSENITKKRLEDEAQRKKNEAEKQSKFIKNTVIGCIIIALVILVMLIPTIKENLRKRSIENSIQGITTILEQKIESRIDDDVVIDFSYEKFMGYDDSLMWSFDVKMSKFEEYRKSDTKDEQLLIEIMDNCRTIEKIIEEENDTFDFELEYNGECISINNCDGSVDFRDLSSYETFYYEEYGGTRYLHSGDTEYVIKNDW